MADNEQILNINYYYYNKTDIDNILENYAEKNHTHDEYLTNTSLNTKVDIAQGTNKALKNVVTDANGNITTENKPNIPTKVSDLQNDVGFINDVDWTDINNKPNNFTPSTHTHVKADITNFPTIPSKTTQIKDPSAYDNIGSIANATQANINSLIDSKFATKINISDIQDNLISNTTDQPLSAKQGKTLNESINTLTENYNTLSNTLNTKENVSNKITSWSNSASDTKYPSEKLVKTNLNNKVDKVSGKGLSTNDFTDEYKNKILNMSTNDNILYCYNRKNTNITISDFLTNEGYDPSTISQYADNFENFIEQYYGVSLKSFFSGWLGSIRDEYNSEESFTTIFSTETFLYFEDDIWEDNKYHVIVITESSPYYYQCDYYGLTSILPLNNIAFDGLTIENNLTTNDNNPATSKAIKDYVDGQVEGVVAGDIDLSTTHNHDDRYFTETEITTQLNTKENTSNKTSSWNSTTNNTRYPTEKLVKDSLDLKSNSNHTHTKLVKTGVIPANADLNSETYAIEGYYYISGNNAATLTGSPVPGDSHTARMEIKVYESTNSNLYIQFYYMFYSSYIDIYYRSGTKNNNSGVFTWNNWVKLSNMNDIPDISTKANINHTHDIATDTTDGFLSKDDKKDIDTSHILKYTTATSSDGLVYTSTIESITSLRHGTIIALLFKKKNLGSITLNLNNFGAKPVYYEQRALVEGEIPINSVCLLFYSTWASFDSNGAWVLIHSPYINHTHNEYNKTTYSQTLPSNTTGVYEIGEINVDGTNTILYGKDTNTTYTAEKGLSLDNNKIGHSNDSITPLTTSTLKKITYDTYGHITDSSDVQKSDIVALGIPENDTNTTYTAGTGLNLSNNQFSAKYGTSSSTACVGNDSRLSDPRIPKFVSITASSTNIVDLNTAYKTSGFYYCSSNDSAKYIIHTPDSNGTETPYDNNKAFHLLVQAFGQSHNSYVKQTLTYYYTGKTYIRVKQGNDDNSWSDWQEISINGHTHTKSNITDFPTSMTPTAHTDSNGDYGKATTSVYGHTKLSTSTSSTSTSLAATPSAVKSAYDLANSKSTVSFTQTQTSGTEIGEININGTNTTLYQQDTDTTYSAGTNLSLSGTTFNHSTSGVGTATTTAALKAIKYDSQGHITGVANPPSASTTTAGIVKLGTTSSTAATGNHTHTSASITDNQSAQYTNIGLSTNNQTQTNINSAINETIGNITSFDYKEIISTGNAPTIFNPDMGGNFTDNSKITLHKIGKIVIAYFRVYTASGYNLTTEYVSFLDNSQGSNYAKLPEMYRPKEETISLNFCHFNTDTPSILTTRINTDGSIDMRVNTSSRTVGTYFTMIWVTN